jgi:hypothetical protein
MNDEKAKPSETEATLQEEVERLRKETAALRKEMEKQKEKKKRKPFNWRNFVAWILIILFFIAALASPVAVWAHDTLLNTDDFVDTVAPLITDDTVAQAISNKAAEELIKELDVDNRLENALPEDLGFLAGPITGVLQDLASRAAKEVLTSSQFQYIWENALRFAHSTALEVIKGDKVLEVTTEGEVVLNLSELLQEVKNRLVDSGLGFLENVKVPDDVGQVVLFTSDELGLVKEGVNILDTLNWLLPLLALLFLAGAILISNDRRKFLLISGVALALAMAVLLIILDFTKSELLNKVSPANLPAAEVIWNTMSGGLVSAAAGLLALGVVAAVGAAIAGPYKWATWLRTKVAELFIMWRDRQQRGDKEPGPVGKFVQTYRMAFWIGGFAVVVIVLLAVSKVTVGLVIGLAIGLVVYLVLIELIRSGPFEEAEGEGAEETEDEKGTESEEDKESPEKAGEEEKESEPEKEGAESEEEKDEAEEKEESEEEEKPEDK